MCQGIVCDRSGHEVVERIAQRAPEVDEEDETCCTLFRCGCVQYECGEPLDERIESILLGSAGATLLLLISIVIRM